MKSDKKIEYKDEKRLGNVKNMVWMVKYITLGYIGYDFINTRSLNPKALKTVENLFDEMADVDGRKRKVFFQFQLQHQQRLDWGFVNCIYRY